MTSEMVIQTEGLTERFGNITAVGDLSTGISHIGSLQSGFHRVHSLATQLYSTAHRLSQVVGETVA